MFVEHFLYRKVNIRYVTEIAFSLFSHRRFSILRLSPSLLKGDDSRHQPMCLNGRRVLKSKSNKKRELSLFKQFSHFLTCATEFLKSKVSLFSTGRQTYLKGAIKTNQFDVFVEQILHSLIFVFCHVLTISYTFKTSRKLRKGLTK
jgi:hypothetical protein